MLLRGRLGGAVARWRRPSAIGLLVLVGLAVSGLVNVWIEPPGRGTLPGVALGSETVLIVERVLALFAAWLLVLVVVVQAFRGHLPTEVSGRGVRYAEAGISQDGLLDSTDAFGDLDRQVNALADAVVALERSQVQQADDLRRYAMRG